MKKVTGLIYSGSEEDVIPLNNYEIFLYGILENKSILISQTLSNKSGKFIFTNILLDTYLYYVKCIYKNDKKKQLINIFSENDLKKTIIVNERISVASIYCFNKFFTKDSIYGNKMGLKIALGMKNNLVNRVGLLSKVILSNPNGDETNTKKLFNTLSNIYVYGIRSDTDNLLKIFNINDENNINLIYIFYTVATNPFLFSKPNSERIVNDLNLFFQYSFVYKPFKPFLNDNRSPSSYTLVIKVNKTGDDKLLFGGPANINFDKQGNAWITNNINQGGADSCNYTVVLSPNGKPASFSPIVNDKIVGAAYGISQNGDNILVSNFGWGDVIANGGIVTINTKTKDVNVINDEMFRVQGIAVDQQENIWIASYGNSKIVVILKNKKIISYDLENNAQPFDVVCTNDNKVYFSVSNIENDNVIFKSKSFVLQASIEDENIIITEKYSIQSKKLLGMAFDSQNNIYICSPLNNKVHQIKPISGDIIDFTDGIYTPWGCSVDGEDNIWIANFGPNIKGDFCITKYSQNGQLLTPKEGLTLDSGGDQVRLSNGKPLYDRIKQPSYKPLMRMTNCPIDMAGNVWAINNWKPSIINNLIVENTNPGGDGICIFIGIAGKLNNY